MDTNLTASDWIALAAVLAAVATAIVGVITGIVDRRSARRTAEEDRRASARQARLMFEWEAAQRLAINLARGGHTDPVIRKDMGAEALALIALLGPERVPHMWEERVGKSDDEMQAFVDDQSNERWLRNAAEAERAMNNIAKEIRQADQGDSSAS